MCLLPYVHTFYKEAFVMYYFQLLILLVVLCDVLKSQMCVLEFTGLCRVCHTLEPANMDTSVTATGYKYLFLQEKIANFSIFRWLLWQQSLHLAAYVSAI